jgi:hypothetical protein
MLVPIHFSEEVPGNVFMLTYIPSRILDKIYSDAMKRRYRRMEAPKYIGYIYKHIEGGKQLCRVQSPHCMSIFPMGKPLAQMSIPLFIPSAIPVCFLIALVCLVER